MVFAACSAAALVLLRDPSLVEQILAGFALVGVVGEETNKLMGYLAALSRKLLTNFYPQRIFRAPTGTVLSYSGCAAL